MKKIIVAPLNWGLGHASRCVVIIRFLLQNDLLPVIASDGAALDLLRKEFPEIPYLELPSYQISYGKRVSWNLLVQTPQILRSIKNEQQVIADYLTKNSDVIGIISDNRFGVRSNRVPSVYLTHQLRVLSGPFTIFTSYIHQKIISRFDECWIPDNNRSEFSGKLSIVKNKGLNTEFIGILSRFKPEKLPLINDVLIVLSGPEPNRTQLENRLIKLFLKGQRKVVLVRGVVENTVKKSTEGKLTVYNFLATDDLEKEMNQSKMVLCRSGYSSIMDLAVLKKKAFLIPTKNQPEQEYLAAYLSEKKGVCFSTESSFTLEKMNQTGPDSELKTDQNKLDSKLLGLFHGK